MLDGDIVRDCLTDLAQRREEQLLRAQGRLQAFLLRHPPVEQALRAMRAVGVAAARQALVGSLDEGPTREAQARYQALLAQALAQDNLSEADLWPPAQCPVCGDTGFTGDDGHLCDCVMTEVLARMNQSSRLREDYTFDRSDLLVIPDDEPLSGGRTQRQQMEQVQRFCRRWADEYPQNAKSTLLLTGVPGLGKTFLLHSIAHRVMERRQGAVFSTTAYHIIAEVRNGFDALGSLQVYLVAPLLLIDDLGTEPRIAGVTDETLFTVLNERQAAGRHTLVSTNLSLTELGSRYSERILSRLTQRDAAVLRLEGRDLRKMRRE